MSKLSYTTMACPDWDGQTAIKKAREYGFQGVDLRISDHLGELRIASTDAEMRELKKIFSDEGIMPSSLLAYNEQAKADPSSWGKFKESVLKNLEVGTKLGTNLVRIFVSNPDSAGDHKAFIGRCAEVLADALQADASPTSLVIQNHSGGVGIHDVLDIMSLVKSPRLHMVLCPANAACMKERLDDVLPIVKGNLPQLYVADLKHGAQYKDGHTTVLPGEGDIDFGGIYAGLGGEKFSGWISFKWEKIWCPELPGPEIALPHFIQYIKQLTHE